MTADEVAALLGSEARAFLLGLVDAVRQGDGARRFMVVRALGGYNEVNHLETRASINPSSNALDQVTDLGLLRHFQRDAWTLAPEADKVAAAITQQSTEALGAVHGRRVLELEAGQFSERYPRTSERLSRAAALVDAGGDEHATEIGHCAREAFQHFADEVAASVGVDVSHIPFEKTANRLGEVFHSPALAELSGTAQDALEAMGDYWKAVSKLAQRQEHGAARNGEPLTWEDSRRLLYLAQSLVFEIDRLVNVR